MVSAKFAKAVFEFRLACILGFEPEMTECTCCGNPLETAKMRFLNAEDGIMLCGECREGKVFPVSQSVYDALRYISNAKSSKIFSFSVDDKALNELGQIAEKYLHLRLDRKYKTLDFLKTLI